MNVSPPTSVSGGGSGSGVIQSTFVVKDNKLHQNNGEITPGGLFIRDAKQINNDIVKITREPVGVSRS